ncbi:TPA: hypothetical protein KOS81_000078 [Clostridioides difficile]|uniref:lanthionine synthetase LanC family protein n=1 Tax=Clostridioides difficile TaxID=1496 RepID=UPI001C1611C9|nr:hypothetical protein [Clostridioides difficile]MBY2232351.1 hypothetical protein [Clostridioides difficile]MCW0824050.1 hypothetical protein [Clostridioides difficile]HBF6273173.1 hypothetical protein [Clostridioides difficile]HBY3543753.1 hypothetical protein [Clostridioides difficile]
MILQKSKIELENEYFEKIKYIIEWYMLSIKEEYLNDYIPPFRYEDYLITISEFLPLMNNESREEYIEMGYSLAKGIKHKLEYEFENYKNPYMYSDLGYMAFSVYLFNKKTGLLEKFLYSLNNLLLNECYKKVIVLTSNNIFDVNTKNTDYDSIYGVSGVLNYLLEFKWRDEDLFKIIKLGEYLMSLCLEYEYKGYMVPRFHIKPENLINEKYKYIFPEGSLDFGMAHGMLAPLISITKLKNKIENIREIDKAIDKIFNLYDIFLNKDDGYYKWPSQLSIEDYLKEESNYNSFTMSRWCYGGISIAKGLRNASLNLKNDKLVKKYDNILKNLLTYKYDEYCLTTPILCHGHSSILSVMTIMYKETNDKDYLYNLNMTLKEIFQLFEPSLKYGFKTLDDSIINSTSFLEGTTGIILSLISILSKESDYEKLLFLS